jgi:hypothetical protein
MRAARNAKWLGWAAMHDNAGQPWRITWHMNASVAVVTNFTQELLTARPRLRALACVLVVSGCAGSAPQPETKSEPARTPTQMCHIDHALLVPVRAPDCGFGRADLKTVDPEQWTHLKLEFERKCYQNAEKTAREQLRRLQAAARCEVKTAER